MKTFRITKNSQYIQSIQLDKGTYTYSCNVKSDATVLTIAFQNTMGVWTDFEIPILSGMWNKKAKLTFDLKEKMVNFDLCKYASNENMVYVQAPMLEEGTNASTPKSSDLDDLEQVEAEIEAVQASIDEAKNEALALGYLKEAIGQDAVINGALFTLVTMLLKENMNGDVTAGISGKQTGEGGQKNLPAFWGGGKYDEAIGGTAKVIIRHDGSGHLAGGNISWDEDGNVVMSGIEATNAIFSGLVKVPFKDGDYAYSPIPRELRNYTFTNNNDLTVWYLPEDNALNGTRVTFINWRTKTKTLRLSNSRFFGKWYSGDTKRYDIPANSFCEMIGFSIGTTFQGWLITNSGTII